VVEAADRQAGMFRGQITGNLLGVVGPDYSAWG
jgi:hypothetical protein